MSLETPRNYGTVMGMLRSASCTDIQTKARGIRRNKQNHSLLPSSPALVRCSDLHNGLLDQRGTPKNTEARLHGNAPLQSIITLEALPWLEHAAISPKRTNSTWNRAEYDCRLQQGVLGPRSTESSKMTGPLTVYFTSASIAANRSYRYR